MESLVEPAEREKLLRRSLLGDLAMVDDKDPVTVRDCRKAVRDENHRAPLADMLDIVHDDALRLIIERTRRLIKDKNPRVREKGTRDCNALTLPA